MGKKNYAAENLVWGAILLAGAYWYFFTGDEDPTQTTAAKAATEREDAACAADLDCWASKWQVRAGRDCQEPIQRLAKNRMDG